MHTTRFWSIILLFIFTNLAAASEINVGSFNVNSGRTAPSIIAQQILDHDIDIWGLSESSDTWSDQVLSLVNARYKALAIIKGTTGWGNSRLQIIYDTTKFSLLSAVELHDINIDYKVRSPLVAKFVDLKTHQEFLFMVNHLYRKNSKLRAEQARKINLWTRAQVLPIIAVGDYNFDMSPYDTSKHGNGYDELTRDNVYTWIQPAQLFPTQCSSYNSILDFVFISDKLHYSYINSVISYSDMSYCKPSNHYSDHRPVTAAINW